MWSVASLRRDPSTAMRMLAGLLSRPSRPVWEIRPNLVASATRSRRPCSACDEFFVDVGAVNLGGVDQRDAEVDRAVNRADGFGVVGAGAGVGDGHAHRAQAEAPNVEVGEMSPFHGAIVRQTTSSRGAGTVTRVHDAARPVRNMAADFYRVSGVVLIVLGHWLAGSVTYHDGSFGRQNPLVDMPWTQWLTWPFQAVPTFFSWPAMPARCRGGIGARPRGVAADLAEASAGLVLGPTAVYVALVSVVVLLLGAGHVAGSTLEYAGWAVAMHLWFWPCTWWLCR